MIEDQQCVREGGVRIPSQKDGNYERIKKLYLLAYF